MTADGGNAFDLTSLSFDVAYKTDGDHDVRVLVTSDMTEDSYDDRLDLGDGGSLPNVLQSDLGEIGEGDAQGNVDWSVADNTLATLGAEFINISSATFRLYAFALRGGMESRPTISLDSTIS